MPWAWRPPAGTSTTVVAFSATHTAAVASIDEAQGADTTDPIVTNAVGTAVDTGLSYSVTRSIAGVGQRDAGGLRP